MGTQHRLIEVAAPADLERFTHCPGIRPLAPEDFIRDAPDTHWALIDSEGRLAARCSLWWTSTPPFPGHRLGFIGHCAGNDSVTARPLLAQACAELAASGCTLAVAPIDGSTWRHYRFITDRGTEPTFFLEPDNSDDWPGRLVEQGFTSLARYRSALTTDLTRNTVRLDVIARRMKAAGVVIRPLDLEQIHEELKCIYAVAVTSFSQSYLFKPIDETAFLEEYRRVLRFVRDDLVLIARQQDRPVGFLFAVPDWLQAGRGCPVDTIVIKTVAVVPGRLYAGLGSLLATRCEELAAGLGYKRAIHALMPETGTSRNISSRYAKTIRRYTLFARTLP